MDSILVFLTDTIVNTCMFIVKVFEYCFDKFNKK